MTEPLHLVKIKRTRPATRAERRRCASLGHSWLVIQGQARCVLCGCPGVRKSLTK